MTCILQAMTGPGSNAPQGVAGQSKFTAQSSSNSSGGHEQETKKTKTPAATGDFPTIAEAKRKPLVDKKEEEAEPASSQMGERELKQSSIT